MKIRINAEIDTTTGHIGVGDPDIWMQLGYFMEVVAMLGAASVPMKEKNISSVEEMADYVSQYITMAMMKAKPKPKRKP